MPPCDVLRFSGGPKAMVPTVAQWGGRYLCRQGPVEVVAAAGGDADGEDAAGGSGGAGGGGGNSGGGRGDKRVPARACPVLSSNL